MRRGERMSDEARAHLSAVRRTPEMRARISASLRGHPVSAETRAKMAATRRAYWESHPPGSEEREAQSRRMREQKLGGSGSENPNWNGGRTRLATGYIQVRCTEHPHADPRGYVLEHRLVMERHIGRLLRREEVVHHVDGDNTNNRIENLQLLENQTEHALLHQLGTRVGRSR